ncbi:MAG: hypothetical protein PHR47_02810 [Candidatus Pacebacteria bacterium]|nr:hypothetical protein [Candidatus Paceibacterota bacterium]
MIKQVVKFLLIAIFLYLLIMIQTSIFYFSCLSFWLTILIVLGFNIFESSKQETGIFVALWAGLLIDIYSSTFFFGFYSIILMIIAVFVKLFIARYVRIP